MTQTFEMTLKQKRMAFAVMGLGVIGLVLAFLQDPSRGWVNVFVNGFYFLSLPVAALFFITVCSLTSSSWWVGLRRVPEAMMAFLPVGAVLMLAVYFGHHAIYPWSDHDYLHQHHHVMAKTPWLNVPFFFARMVVILGIWWLFALALRRNARRQDQASGPEAAQALEVQKKSFKVSAIFIPVFAVSFCIAAFDWIMSIEPMWFSTIFPILNFSSLFLHGVAVIALIVILLRERGYLEGVVNENHTHDLAKLILAFSTFWVCMWVDQYMLIWYTNISEEVVYFTLRTDGDWHWLFILNIVVNWLVPFLILVIRNSKRSYAVLKRVCILLLVGHWIDLYVQMAPPILKTRSIGIPEVLTSLGYGALFFYVVARALASRPLVAKNDPYLAECLEHRQ